MVMISLSSNVLLPSPSFIVRIITSLRSSSEVTIGWWTGLIVRNCSHRPACGPGVHSRSDMVSSSSTTKESLQGRLVQELLWPHGPKGRTTNNHFLCSCWQASQALVVVEERMQGIPRLVHRVHDI
ncbi:hypothetical protein O181_129401 [Austropuccinia psidii MF-1]|uniref:Uncharacterized protein n=1 Tax=Austropuccinia psidii MF-1 TaxID=1389203 RepID=A0A9Q3Q8J0_9BASI|nr:hypothetical protein [Austropuccinia psidii MF-1]